MPSDTVSSQLFASQKEKKASYNKPCSLEKERENVNEEIPCATETSKGHCCPKFSFTDRKRPVLEGTWALPLHWGLGQAFHPLGLRARSRHGGGGGGWISPWRQVTTGIQ